MQSHDVAVQMVAFIDAVVNLSLRFPRIIDWVKEMGPALISEMTPEERSQLLRLEETRCIAPMDQLTAIIEDATKPEWERERAEELLALYKEYISKLEGPPTLKE